MTGVNTRSSGRVTHLDGLRGIAILTVFVVHWARFKVPFFTGGYIGVDIFFVLSGYIITTLLVRRSPSYRSFIGDRLRRLYPPLLGLLVFGTLLIAIWPRAGVSFSDGWRDALVSGAQLSSPWLAGQNGDLGPFTVTWSLAVEWYFYLVWPLIVVVLVRRPPITAVRLLVSAAVVLYVAALAMPATWFYFGPVARFGEMAAGAALAFWTLDGRKVPPTAVKALAWFAPVFVAGWTLFGSDVESWGYRLAGFPLTVLCAIVLIAAGNRSPETEGRHPVVTFLEWRPLVWVGGISYTLYLWHTFPIVLIPRGWYGLSMPVLGAIGLSLVVVTTAVAFVLLEKPFRHRRTADLRPGLTTSSTS